MILDENAAAFGLFQLAFANLHQQLATVVFFLRRAEEPNLKFGEVFGLTFSRLHKTLKKQLSKLDRNPSMSMEIQFLKKACSKIGPLARWRNDRAHPRVRIDENGIRIFNWKTGKALSLDREECLEKIHQAIRITVDIEMYGAGLSRQLDGKKKIDAMIDEIFKSLEDSDKPVPP
jgi:hypothetical protein